MKTLRSFWRRLSSRFRRPPPPPFTFDPVLFQQAIDMLQQRERERFCDDLRRALDEPDIKPDCAGLMRRSLRA